MTLGLGTGSTVAHLLPAIAERGLKDLRCVATSVATEEQARRAGHPGRGLRHARAARHRDRRRRPDRPRPLARQGRRRRPHPREDRRGDRRALRRDRRLLEAGGARSARRSRSSCTRTASPRRCADRRRDGPGRAPSRHPAQPRRRRDRRLQRQRSATRRSWPPGSRTVPGVVDHGLFPASMVPRCSSAAAATSRRWPDGAARAWRQLAAIGPLPFAATVVIPVAVSSPCTEPTSAGACLPPPAAAIASWPARRWSPSDCASPDADDHPVPRRPARARSPPGTRPRARRSRPLPPRPQPDDHRGRS